MRRWRAIAILQTQTEVGIVEADTFDEAGELAWAKAIKFLRRKDFDDLLDGIEVVQMDMQEEK